MKHHEILQTAIDLTTGQRDKTHGEKSKNMDNIASLWNAHLYNKYGWGQITFVDVPLMMALLKIARTELGEHNLDDYIDGSGYLAIAGELADLEEQ